MSSSSSQQLTAFSLHCAGQIISQYSMLTFHPAGNQHPPSRETVLPYEPSIQRLENINVIYSIAAALSYLSHQPETQQTAR